MGQEVTVTIHQPNYIPWLGYFSKIKQCQKFVVLDIADYTRNNFINRNKIRTKGGWAYLTIPIEHAYIGRQIRETQLPADARWCEKHLRSVRMNYARAGYFDSYMGSLESAMRNALKKGSLSAFNMELVGYLLKEFGIETEIVLSSELPIDATKTKTELLIEILDAVGAKRYLTGRGSKEYLDEKLFGKIGLEYHNFVHPVYRQAFDGFQECMSAIDILLNEGEKAGALI